MKQLSKQEYQKRAILIQKLAFLLELNNKETVASILCYMVSPIGRDKHPFKWSDNELLGVIEKEINKLENGIDDDDDE